MKTLKSFIMGALSLATPGTIETVKSIISGLVGIGAILKDNGDPATASELEDLWDECEKNFRTFKSEREASNRRVAADIAAANHPKGF